MYKHFILILITFNLLSASLFAKAAPRQQAVPGFRENKGQLTDQYGRPRKDIQFKFEASGLSVFVGAGALHYQWSKTATASEPVITPTDKKAKPHHIQVPAYRMDMVLTGINPHARIIVKDTLADFEQYFGTQYGQDGMVAHAYKKVVYKDIYPHIDWVLYTNDADKKLEYDFVVRPGGKVSDIKYTYQGATALHLNDKGGIEAETPYGHVTEQAPHTFIQATHQPIASCFKLNRHSISFNTGRCDSTIVIDPTLEWATYYGDTMNDISSSVACDAAGNVYMCGATQSTQNIATAGSYLDSVSQDFHGMAFLVKFNSAGIRQWATYYAGGGFSIACDHAGNVYLTGNTTSATGVATPGTYQPTFDSTIMWSASGDAYLVKFNSAGVRQWGTYYGYGSAEALALACDNNDNVYMVGYTQSDTGLASPGSYQPTSLGSNAFLVKFNSTGARQWATYYGHGSIFEWTDVSSVACDKANNVYIVGTTSSYSLIATPNSFQSTCGGGTDGYIVKFDSAGMPEWGTYYGGSNSDYCYDIVTDDSADVYVVGSTYGFSPNVVSPGCYQGFFGGGSFDALLIKFDSAGNRRWATYYGGEGNDEGNSLTADDSANVYLYGWTTSTTNIATPSAYQDTFGGSTDAYVAKFNKAGVRQWGTYYGGTGQEQPGERHSIGWDGNNSIYFCGIAAWAASSLAYSHPTDIATPGSFKDTLSKAAVLYPALPPPSPTMEYASQDAFLVKFHTCDPPQQPIAVNGDTIVCPHSVQTYSVPSVAGASSYKWILPSGWQGNSTTDSIIITIGDSSGSIRVSTVNQCGDTSKVQLLPVYVVPFFPNPDTGSLAGGCTRGAGMAWISPAPNDSTAYTYVWGSATGGILQIQPNDSIADTLYDLLPGKYTINVSDAYSCMATFSVTVPVDSASFTGNSIDTVCPHQLLTFTNTSTGDTPVSYLWILDNGITDTATTLQHIYDTPGNYTIMLIANFGICSDTAIHYIRVVSFPDTLTNLRACYGDSLRLSPVINTPGYFGGYNYTWSPTTRVDDPDIQSPMFYGVPGNYTYVCTVMAQSYPGCTLHDTVSITVYAPPILINVTPDQVIGYGDTLQLNADGATFYNWTSDNGTLKNPDIKNPVVAPLDATIYTVIGLDSAGCADTATVHIGIAYTPDFIPNAFTPNGDGRNDVFRVVNIENRRLVEMSIFNRWGENLFYSIDPNKGWDGTYKGVPQEIGTYNYLVILVDQNGIEQSYKGNITLIR